MNERLDSILDIDPSPTQAATSSPLDMPDSSGPGGVIVAEVVPPPDSNTTALVAQVAAAPAAILPDKQMEELQEDMDYARLNMKDVIDQAKGAFTGALEMADSGGEPRAYEVVSQMIQAIIEANKALISLHKTRKDTLKTDKEVKQTGEASAGTTINNIEKAVFVGRAQDLLRELKQIEKNNVA